MIQLGRDVAVGGDGSYGCVGAEGYDKYSYFNSIRFELSEYTPKHTPQKRRLGPFAVIEGLTGARDSAIASIKLKHVDLIENCVHQDARDVKTKFSKTFTTYFFPVGEYARQIVADWVRYLGRRSCGGTMTRCFRLRT